MKKVILIPLQTIPLVEGGNSVTHLIREACQRENVVLENGDIIVIAQKIISKAERAIVDLKSIVPSEQAKEIAAQSGRDPRLVQVYLNESSEVLYVKGRTVVTRHRLGFIMSSSGVDRSNIASHAEEIVVLLPTDPDASARLIKSELYLHEDKKVAVIINDSGGRSDRAGSVGIAIGIAGIAAVEVRNQQDLFGNPSNSQIALIDELAAAASILMGQADEKVPIVIIKGVKYTPSEDANILNILN